jgi:hypothetical protein
MKENFDTLHGTILLKANYRVNRSAKSKPGSFDCGFGAAAHTIRYSCMMGVKDYVHFCLPL